MAGAAAAMKANPLEGPSGINSHMNNLNLRPNNNQQRRSGNNNVQRNQQNSAKKPATPKFAPYWPKEQVQSGLKRNELIEGQLRINQRNYEEAYLDDPEGENDIMITGLKDRNRAFHGDVVVIKLKPKEQWKDLKTEVTKTGEVVYITERKHSRAAVGKLKPMSDGGRNFALFSPTDSRIPRIMITANQLPEGFFDRPQDFAKYVYIARVKEWNEFSTFAKGELCKSLGLAGEIGPETEGLLVQFDIDDSEFSEEVISCLPKVESAGAWTIPKEEFSYRRDFRQEMVFSIDPTTARDLDDALHVKYLGDGYHEVGVHIADVSFFIQPDNELDLCAASRATSTYMVHKVIPMLPRLLCEELCSLNPGVERLSFSVCWKMNVEGEIVDEWFGRSVIASVVKLTYDHAQGFLDEPDREWDISELPPLHNGATPKLISEAVNLLNRMAKSLRKRRFEGGALRLDQPKLSFSLDKETGLPNGCCEYKLKDSNRLIEEFMLLANMAVAHRLNEYFPDTAVLRRHPSPKQKMLRETLKLCETLGYPMSGTSAGALAESLQKYISDSKRGRVIMLTLTQLLMKPMQLAQYFCTGTLKHESLFHHYALNVPLYTHFTSPIRRYPDLMVHRLLAASLGYCEPIKLTPKKIDHYTKHCNDKKKNAKDIGDASSEMFFAVFVKECGPLDLKAVVVAVSDYSFDVLISRYGIVKRVYCNRQDLLGFESEEGPPPSLTMTWNSDTGKAIPAKTIMKIQIMDEIDVSLNQDKEPLKYWVKVIPPKKGEEGEGSNYRNPDIGAGGLTEE